MLSVDGHGSPSPETEGCCTSAPLDGKAAPTTPDVASSRDVGSGICNLASSTQTPAVEVADAVHMKERIALLEELLRQSRGTMSGIGVPAIGGGSPPKPKAKGEADAEKKKANEEDKSPSSSNGAGKGKGKGKGLPPPPPAKAATPPPAAPKADSPANGKGKGPGKGKAGPPPKAKAPPGKAGAPPPRPGGPNAKGACPAPKNKSDVKPKTAMKRLFWSSFVLDDEAMMKKRDTVWGAIHEEGSEAFDFEELERLFGERGHGCRPQSQAAAGAESVTEGKKQRAKIRVFEETRRRQVCVMLARLPHVNETLTAVLEMDDMRLNKDQVELLLSNAPSAEELAALRSATAEYEAGSDGEAVPWDDAEAFVCRLSAVPSFALRLQAWVFENSFDERFSIFQTAATDISDACTKMRSSPHVKQLLALSLSVGNYLNAGTTRGCADGFSVETLIQMKTMKTSCPGPTANLADFVVRQLETAKPGSLDSLFLEDGEAHAVRRAARHKIADLQAELTVYCNQASGLARRTASAEDDCLAVRGDRVNARHKELEALQVRLTSVQDEYKALCVWFQEGQSKAPRPSDEFFSLWDGFLEGVRVALENTSTGRARKKRMSSGRMQRPSLETCQNRSDDSCQQRPEFGGS
eukprot:gnl/TRDRNA2_/TRDRNA2_171213_c2_seq6.p1 gnl/TRDRNA2_/TRDRNA2_171213_c2~~gnl/TRDRNA2_/TRDRNA2_171213_c2_seq6.p1  ORF type:complete len:657 (+),score=159.50 gnl/TRDRNA2_/TRDRNA2_171213_c2_seq6:59-1972(+)